jgi:hypothetical protein
VHDAPVVENFHRRHFGLRDEFRVAELALLEPVLLVPGDGPAGVGVELPPLFGEDFGQGLVDEGRWPPGRSPPGRRFALLEAAERCRKLALELG